MRRAPAYSLRSAAASPPVRLAVDWLERPSIKPSLAYGPAGRLHHKAQFRKGFVPKIEFEQDPAGFFVRRGKCSKRGYRSRRSVQIRLQGFGVLREAQNFTAEFNHKTAAFR